MRTRKPLALVAILTTMLALGLSSLTPDHEWGGDYTWYLAQAESLVDGKTDEVVRQGEFRVANTTGYIGGPRIYPWGYPVILTPVYAAAGHNLMAVKSLGVLFIAVACWLLYLLLRERGQALWVVAAVAFSPWLFEFKNTVNSELPFLALTILALLLIQRTVVDDKPILSTATSGILVGLGIFAAYWVRTHGMALLPTLLAVQLWRGLKPGHIIPYAAFGVAYLFDEMLPGSASYVGSGHFEYGSIQEVLRLIASNAILYGAGLIRFLQNSWPLKALLPLAGLLFFFASVGVIKRWRDDYLYIFFAAFYMGVLLVYPFRQFRFVLCAIPFLFYFAFQGAAYFRVQRYFGGALVGMALATSLVLWVKAQGDNPVIEGPYTKEAREAFAFIREKTPKDAAFVFWKPRVLTFYTGRNAYFRYTDGPLRGADFALIYDGPNRRGQNRNAILLNAIGPSRPIWKNNKFSVYRIPK